MQKTSYYCDRCGKEFVLTFDKHEKLEDGFITVRVPFIHRDSVKVDLCRTCFKELNKIAQDYSIELLDFAGYKDKKIAKEKEVKDISNRTIIEWGTR